MIPERFIRDKNIYKKPKSGGEYINKEYWDDIIIDGKLMELPVSITGMSFSYRSNETLIESGRGSVIEFFGREPMKFTLRFDITSKVPFDFDKQVNEIYDILKKGEAEGVSISHPTLLRHDVFKFFIKSWSYTYTDLYMSITVNCNEYSDLYVKYLKGYEMTEEQHTADTITDDDIDNSNKKFGDTK